MLGEGFVAQSTHDVTVVGRRVVKHYRSWDEGEPEREWAGLTLLHRFAPGLAPEPLEQRVDGGAPVVGLLRPAVGGQPSRGSVKPPPMSSIRSR